MVWLQACYFHALGAVQVEKVAGEEALQAVQGALGAAQADGAAAHGEAATLAAALDAAEKARAALEDDLTLHVERHAAGMQVRSWPGRVVVFPDPETPPTHPEHVYMVR